ncbi:glycosyltransferase family 4 protein [Rhizobiaceae bacterium]|nr:glycosyltransferase family 4 protein [Rhizobiaceae bacterium]
MHILYVVNELAYFRAHRERLALAMVDRGHRVSVATGEWDGVVPADWDDRVRLHRLDVDRHGNNPLRDTGMAVQVRRIIKAEEPDILHGLTIKPILYGALAAASLGSHCPRVVWTFAGLGKVFEPSRSLLARARRKAVSHALRRLQARTNAAATFENEADLKQLVAEGIVPAHRAFRVHGTGLDLSVFCPPAQPRSGPPVVLMAARLINEKGVDTFLEAASAVGWREGTRFLLAGPHDPTNPYAVDLASLRSKRVEWLGPVPQGDMPALFGKADLAVLPTRLREGFPRSLLEAAACGCALIATAQPPMREIVLPGRTGWLLDRPTAASLRAALVAATSDIDRTREMGQAALDCVRSGPYSEETVFEVFARLYE